MTSRYSLDETSHSSRTVSAAAPRTGPSKLPMPPSASITSTRTSTRPKAYVDGLMKPSLWAYRAPASPTIAEPSVPAATRQRFTSIPASSAATSSSRNARNAHPMRDRCSARWMHR